MCCTEHSDSVFRQLRSAHSQCTAVVARPPRSLPPVCAGFPFTFRSSGGWEQQTISHSQFQDPHIRIVRPLPRDRGGRYPQFAQTFRLLSDHPADGISSSSNYLDIATLRLRGLSIYFPSTWKSLSPVCADFPPTWTLRSPFARTFRPRPAHLEVATPSLR